MRTIELTDVGQGTLAAFFEICDAVTLGLAQRERLDAQISQMAAGSQFIAVANRFCGLRRINTLNRFALAVEICD